MIIHHMQKFSLPTSSFYFLSHFNISSFPIPYWPFCTWVKYCLLVVFQAAMYFSMQLV